MMVVNESPDTVDCAVAEPRPPGNVHSTVIVVIPPVVLTTGAAQPSALMVPPNNARVMSLEFPSATHSVLDLVGLAAPPATVASPVISYWPGRRVMVCASTNTETVVPPTSARIGVIRMVAPD